MSLKINQAIYSILSSSTGVTSLVNSNNMFPIAADDDVKNPFIVYERKSINTVYTKDGVSYDDVLLEVTCVSDDYNESLNIAQAVRNALELKSGTYGAVEIYQCRFKNAPENYGVDNYIQILHFEIKSK